MPRDGFNFRSGEAISQQRGIFAVEGHFRSPFRNCEMRSGGCEMALVCQRVVSQLRNPLWNGALATKIGILKLWGFRRAFRSCEMRLGAAKWHLCAKGVFRSCEKFRSCENFRRGGAWGCEIILQPRGDFAGASFRLRNFVYHGFFLAFELLLIPRDFPSISLQFLLN